MDIIISFIIGVLFAGCGISYKIASIGKAYPIQNAAILSVFGASLISTFFMKEKRTLEWYLTVGFSLLAILLNH